MAQCQVQEEEEEKFPVAASDLHNTKKRPEICFAYFYFLSSYPTYP